MISKECEISWIQIPVKTYENVKIWQHLTLFCEPLVVFLYFFLLSVLLSNKLLDNTEGGGQKWTVQRNWQHRVHKTKKNKTQTQHNMFELRFLVTSSVYFFFFRPLLYLQTFHIWKIKYCVIHNYAFIDMKEVITRSNPSSLSIMSSVCQHKLSSLQVLM